MSVATATVARVRTLPTDAEVDRFWAMIESAWGACGEPRTEERLDEFLAELRVLSAGLTSDELTALDRVVERALYDIDRADIHAVVGGSDDGFLYRRGFIVALGREYYRAAVADPGAVRSHGECGQMGYFFAHLHSDRFGTFPDRNSGISRETASNPAGWS